MNNTELSIHSEKIPQANHMKMSRLDDSLFSKELAPHYMNLAGKLASSELVPRSFRNKPQDLFLCWSWGYQVGMTPEQSMQCIAVINGKAVMYGDDLLALCMAHKDFIDVIEEPIINAGQVIGYQCTAKRKGRADKTNIFTLEMAKKAGLLAKGGVWTQYPERMLKLRARGFTLRDTFPDALKGIKPREEVEDYVDADYTVVDEKISSRTEFLRQEIFNKLGIKNDSENNGCDSTLQDMENKSETEEIKDTEYLEETRETPINYHFEIEQLIIEKQITAERIEKALSYYEVNNIAELTDESAQDFIKKLSKI